MQKLKLNTAVALSVACLFLVGCNDKSNKSDSTTDSAALFVSESEYSQQYAPTNQLDAASSIRVMTYNMPDVNENMTEATALVIFPKTAEPEDGWRVVVWQHGTTGVGDECAPSNNLYDPRFQALAEMLLAEGYVVVAPDYEGLGTAGIHPYLNMKSEFNSTAYAIDAIKEKYGASLQGEWMVIGQSQGGQAAVGTAEFASSDDQFKGAIAGAPASSLGEIILSVAPAALAGIEQQEIAANVPVKDRTSVDAQATLLAYAAMAGVGIKSYLPSFDYKAMFQDRSRPFAEFAEGTTGENGLCLTELSDKYLADVINFLDEDSTRLLANYPGIDADAFTQNAALQQFLVDNQPGTKKITKPLLIIQGTADTNVPYVVTQSMVENLKALGSTDVSLELVEGAGHSTAIVERYPQAVEFIKLHMPAKTTIESSS